MRFFVQAGVLTALAIASVPSIADVISMKDGRRFEGTIIADREQSVLIDTVVSTVRVTMTLSKVDVEGIEKKALPAGFYEPAPSAPRLSDPAKFADPDAVYLEVPIKGEFGKMVTADGVRAAIGYARAHRIPHVVFTIDSTGGDLDEANEIYHLLKSQFGQVKLHAIVHNCLGDALSVPAACDTVNVLPGAKIGGLGRKLSDISDRQAAEDEDVLRRQIANELEAAAKQRGRGGRVVRAMVDPSETLAAWRNEKGEVELGAAPPADVKADGVIFKDGPDTVLVLSYEQAIALGMPPFKGEAKDLGAALSFSQWQSESEFGHRAMADAAAARAKREAALQSSFEAKVKTNLARRETAQRSIEHNMKQAAEWSPTKESYATYKAYASRWNWGWGRGYSNYNDEGSYDTNRLTAESRRKWKDRTDASTHYLVETRSAMKTMQRLDAEAVKLGLKPTYRDGELADLIKDIEIKVAYLVDHRQKTSN